MTRTMVLSLPPILVLLLALSHEGATSHPPEKVPAFQELLDRAQQDMATEQGKAYDQAVGKDLGRRLGSMVAECAKSRGQSSVASFRIVIVVAKAGVVSRAAANPETAVAVCVHDALAKERLPDPPFAPFHELIEVAFK